MKKNGLTQKAIEDSSNLTRSMIGRICRNTNDRGSEYGAPEYKVFMASCIGLALTYDEAKTLFYIAYPEMAFLKEILDKHMKIADADLFLYEHGLILTKE